MYRNSAKKTRQGLGCLASKIKTSDRAPTLGAMLELRQLFCAIWTECICLIADASQSATKFIVSDHPVTVYNRRCGPKSQEWRGFNDPNIALHATHTIFPLSLDRV